MNHDAIILRMSHGDEVALDQFMDHWSQRLYHYAYALVRTKEAAEEIVSDVFFEVWRQRKTLTQIDSMNQWLRTVTYRKSISYLRHENSLPDEMSFEDIRSFDLSLMESQPDESIISHEEIDRLNKAMDALPPKSKHVIFLAKIEQIPYQEIAKMLGITLSTVNYHVAYAMNHLRQMLREETIAFIFFAFFLH